MKKGIIGKKLGMTQIFMEDGSVIPVTVIEAGPCPVTQKKTTETMKPYSSHLKISAKSSLTSRQRVTSRRQAFPRSVTSRNSVSKTQLK